MFASFLLCFFSRKFSLRCPVLLFRSSLLDPANLSKLTFWTLAVYKCLKHENSTHYCPAAYGLLCSLVQIPPLRKVVSKWTGTWPVAVARVMPTPRIDQSLRQLLGPPHILFALDASVQYSCKAPVLSLLAAVTTVIAGSLARPDNDWAGTHALIVFVVLGKPQLAPEKSSKTVVKRVHASLMSVSVLSTSVLFLKLKLQSQTRS